MPPPECTCGPTASKGFLRTSLNFKIRSQVVLSERSIRSYWKPRWRASNANRRQILTPMIASCGRRTTSTNGTNESTEAALRLFYKAIELDPDYAQAYAFALQCYVWRNT